MYSSGPQDSFKDQEQTPTDTLQSLAPSIKQSPSANSPNNIQGNTQFTIKEDIIQANEVKFKLNFNYKSATMYLYSI